MHTDLQNQWLDGRRSAPMGWREDIGNFDLGRLTLVGWLIFFLSIGAGVGAGFLAYTILYSVLELQPSSDPQRRLRLPGVAGIAGAIGFFFASKFLLNFIGISLMRPKPAQLDEGQSQQKPQDSRSCISPCVH
jgi:hypothetical protein